MLQRRNLDGPAIPEPRPRFNIPPGRRKLIFSIVGAILAVAIVTSVVRLSPASRPKNASASAMLAARAMVQANMGADARVQLSPLEWTHLETMPDGKFAVTGWLVAAKESGETLYYAFNCVLYQNPDGDWISDKLEFTPQ
jgi:hypothetical protein